jgi:hypothetical protein
MMQIVHQLKKPAARSVCSRTVETPPLVHLTTMIYQIDKTKYI